MSIIVALASEEEIVLAADSICGVEEEECFYCMNVPYSKIHTLPNNTQFAIGIAGAVYGERVIRADLSRYNDFDKDTNAAFSWMKDNYLGGNCRLLFDFIFCGFDAPQKPRIRRASFYEGCDPNTGKNIPMTDGIIDSKYGRMAVGCRKHGALYWMTSFHGLLQEPHVNRLLAYFAVQETIRHDKRTRGPIEMMIVRFGETVEELGPKALDALNAEYQDRRDRIFALLEQPMQPPSQP